MRAFSLIALQLYLLLSFTGCFFQTVNEDDLDLYARANSHYKKKEFDKALELYQQVIDNNKGFLNARLMKSKVLFYSQKYELAKNELKQILKKDHNHIGALLLDSKIDILQNNDPLKTIEKLNKIIEIDPDHLESHILLGLLYEKQSNYKNAINEYLSVIDNEYDIINAHINIAILYRKIDLKGRSYNHLQKAKKMAEVCNYSTEYIEALLEDAQ